jgi:hypothetical protein
MSHGDDHDFLAAIGIDDAERETAKNRLSESPPSRRADSRTFQHRSNCALDIIEKRVP